jgi:S1-C subfamily serine protease
VNKPEAAAPASIIIMPMMGAIVALALSCVTPPSGALSFVPAARPASTAYRSGGAISRRGRHLGSTIDQSDLFWPAASPSSADGVHPDDPDDDDMDDDEKLLASTLDAVVKVYATHSDPDFLIPWQKKHQTSSTSSGFVLDVPGIGFRVMTNAHSVEYGSVVQVQRRGDDEKHAAIVEAVGNECDLALLRVDSLFPPRGRDDGGEGENEVRDATYALPLGPLPPLQDEVEVLGYPAGGDSLCVTKGVVSRIEMQEYAQAGARLLAMQIDAAINPGMIFSTVLYYRYWIIAPTLRLLTNSAFAALTISQAIPVVQLSTKT